ncbi:hypothetical protein SAMN04488516_11528 [Desulfonauticus submarinus]|uniref:Proteinase inhibitor I42 chagasin domain-containing protein n=1 Tax=Desulfonauticus submarinus TaxID=206665 RepID=A0A1H0FYA8_9BACT|nr:hypothetical protein [Desulfonauticus submarinus]SDN99635.1 hypothetical protein SAMN04488516_11528 [Desulfonauticus submarinus]
MKRVFLFLVVSLFLGSSLSFAQDYDKEIKRLKQKIIELQNKAPFGIEKMLPCKKIFNFGMYVPTESTSLRKGDTLLIYIEPKNFFISSRDGMYETWITEDINILDEKGNVVFKKTNMVESHIVSKSPIFDIFFQNSLNLGGVPEGHYKFRAILYDKLKGTSTYKDVDFYVSK